MAVAVVVTVATVAGLLHADARDLDASTNFPPGVSPTLDPTAPKPNILVFLVGG